MQFFQRLYEGIMLLLVMITIMTLWLDHSSNSFINWTVWFIFFIDFCYRLYKASSKWSFLKKNPFLIIAIIPFDQFFQIARIVRLMYFFRLKTITKFYIQPVITKVTYQSKIVMITLVFAFLSIESIIIWWIEGHFTSLPQAFYHVFLQLFFFGQQVTEVEKVISLIMFVSTTVIGVLLHGIALQWLFSKVDLYYQQYRKNKLNENGSNISS